MHNNVVQILLMLCGAASWDGTIGDLAQIMRRNKGKIHRESKIFDRRRAAEVWIDEREKGETRSQAALDGAGATSSEITLKPASVQGPNVVTNATSVASRPRAIRMRPIRGLL
ncbi:hypothetical protein MCBRY_002979 [Methylocystis bryophila]